MTDDSMAAADPLAGIAAETRIQQAAAGAIRRHARDARAAGRSWQQIGEALGCQGDAERGVSAAGEAFRRLASDLGSGLSFPYPCGMCGKTVIDYGPEAGHPEDAERGHADDCGRLAATVAEWDRQWGDE